VLILVIASLGLAACENGSKADVSKYAQRAISARFTQPKLDIIWVEERRVGSEHVACGLAGPHGSSAPSSLFIVRNGQAFAPGDVGLDRFRAMGDRFCGSNWVNPVSLAPAPVDKF
jgi:hypothetical protein